MASLPHNANLPPARLISCIHNKPFRNAVLHAAHSMQICEDSMLLNMLGAVNTAINGKFAVRRANGHVEHAQLFVLVIGKSGERKSAACAWAKRPLVMWASQQAAAGGRIPRLHFDQVSGASLIEALCEGGGRLVCHEPEPTVLTLFGRRDFSKPILTKAFDGETIMLERAGKPTIHIEDPAISMTIASQPEIAYDFGRRPNVSASGLLGRILFFMSQQRAGTREVDTPPIPHESEAYYRDVLMRLLEYPRGADGKRLILTLDQNAEKSFVEFARQTEGELAAGRALSFDIAWGSKLPGKVLRLAALLHCIEYEKPAHIAISEDTIRQAIEQSYVFVQHARNFFFMVQNGDALEVAHLIEQWAAHPSITTFTAKQAHAAFPRYSRRLINAGIDMLMRLGQAYEDLFAYQNEPWRRGRKAGPFYRLTTLRGGIAP